jgi:hypothetical protein
MLFGKNLLSGTFKTFLDQIPIKEGSLMSKPIVIAIVGGPCAGKTSCKEELQQVFGEKIDILPEMATLWMQHGHYPVPGKDLPYSERWAKGFQPMILYSQICAENGALLKAEYTGARAIVCDRGVMDAAVYLEGLKAVDTVLGILDESLLPLARANWPREALDLAEKREKARVAKDFTLADQLRGQIEALGLRVEDTPAGMRLYTA